MPYTPTTWVDDDGSGTTGTVVTAARMNNIEDGVDDAWDVLDALSSTYQGIDTDLTAIAALTSAANKVPYATGAGTWALADFSAFGRTLVDDADAAAGRSTLNAAGLTGIANVFTGEPNEFSSATAATPAILLRNINADMQLVHGYKVSTKVFAIRVSVGGSVTLENFVSGFGITSTGQITLNANSGSSAVNIGGSTLNSVGDATLATQGLNRQTGDARYQLLDTDLTAIAALTSAANKVPYATGAGTWALADFTSFGRSLVDDADAAAGRATLSAASLAANTLTGTQSLTGGSYITADDLKANAPRILASSNATDGEDMYLYRPAASRDWRIFSNQAAADVARFSGSTGRAQFPGGVTGLLVGTDVQAYDSDLAAIAALTSAADKVPYSTGSGTWALADFSSTARTLLDDTSVSAMRTTLGVPTDRVCLVRRTTNTASITNNTITVVLFDAEVYDPAGMHSTVSNTSRITLPEAGVYRLSANARWDSGTTGIRELSIVKNGDTTAGRIAADSKAATGGGSQHSITGLAYWDGTGTAPYYEVYAYHTQGTNDRVLTADGTNFQTLNFQCEKVGA